jgi:hypothetical protein
MKFATSIILSSLSVIRPLIGKATIFGLILSLIATAAVTTALALQGKSLRDPLTGSVICLIHEMTGKVFSSVQTYQQYCLKPQTVLQLNSVPSKTTDIPHLMEWKPPEGR